jgi:hypothetical protein
MTKNLYNQNDHTKQALQRRLDETQALLKTLKDQQVRLQDDLLDLMDRHQTELVKSRQDANNEMQCYQNRLHFYTTQLDAWLSHQRSVASAQLHRHQTWWYQFLLLLAALVGATSFLVNEKREKERWRKQVIQPVYGEQQREWHRQAIDARRCLERSHPQPTPGMRRLEQQVAQARQMFYSITNQIQLQESRIQVLKNQIAAL